MEEGFPGEVGSGNDGGDGSGEERAEGGAELSLARNRGTPLSPGADLGAVVVASDRPAMSRPGCLLSREEWASIDRGEVSSVSSGAAAAKAEAKAGDADGGGDGAAPSSAAAGEGGTERRSDGDGAVDGAVDTGACPYVQRCFLLLAL